MAYSILIVDDSATTRAMIKRIIGMADLPVASLFEAADGQVALDVLAQQKVDLVLADLNMPQMGGVEMTQRMRQNPATKEIPVVVVSAEPNIDRLSQLKQAGVQGSVRKPFTPEVIRDVITQIMGAIHA